MNGRNLLNSGYCPTSAVATLQSTARYEIK